MKLQRSSDCFLESSSCAQFPSNQHNLTSCLQSDAKGAVGTIINKEGQGSDHIFQCRFVVAASLEAGFTVQTPFHCPSNQTKPCKGKSFRHMTELQTMSDYQEIRLQHKASGASTAARSAYTEVLLEDELADSCQPGGMQAIKCLHSMGFEFSFGALLKGPRADSSN